MEAALARFHDEHARAFAFRDDARAVEVYAARLVAVGRVPKPPAAAAAAGAAAAAPAPQGLRPVHFAEVGGFADTPVFRREALEAGARLEGPAVVEQLDSTVILPPGVRAFVTPDLHIIARLDGAAP